MILELVLRLSVHMANLQLMTLTHFSPSCKGKCSHGGAGDLTSTSDPRGGINKDERRPDNMALHDAAVKAATAASLELLQDIRLTAGDDDFLRYEINL